MDILVNHPYLSLALVVFVVLHAFQRTRYYLRTVLNLLSMQLSGLMCLPRAIVSPGNKNALIYMSWMRFFGKVFFNIKYVDEGFANLRGDKAAIIVCNHQSSLDPIVCSELSKELNKVSFVSKKELRYAGFAGLLWSLAGVVFVDRSSVQAARSSLDFAKKMLLEQDMKIIVFPEGTRNRKGSMMPFKKGFFYLAVQAQVPIIPVVFSDYTSFYSSRAKKFERGGTVRITVLPPVSTEGMTDDSVPDLCDRVRNSMLKVYEKTATSTKSS